MASPTIELVDVSFGGAGAARGRAVEVTIAGEDSANITASVGDALGITYSCTREAYSGTTLGTTAVTGGKLYYVSATGSNPAVVTAYADDGWFDDDADLAFAAEANCVPGLTSDADAAIAPTGTTARDYPEAVVIEAGIIDANGDITPKHGSHSGVITIEALAWHPYGIAAVTVEVDDGVTTQTQTLTAMERSAYDPDQYSAAVVANGWADADPYTEQGGGSFVYKADFDLSDFADGSVDVTITAYPAIGDADAVSSVTFDFLNDDGGSATDTEYWVDNEATLPISGSPSAATAGMIYIGDTSGAAIAYRSDDGSTMRCSLLGGTPDVGGETFTAAYNADTFASTGGATVTGDDSAAGTEGAPFLTLAKAIGVAAGDDTERVTIRVVCDNVDPVYVAHGRIGIAGVGVTPDQWQIIQPDDGVDRANVVVYGNGTNIINGGATDPRCNRLAYHNCVLWLTRWDWNSEGIGTFGLRSSNDSQIWFHKCVITDPNGHIYERMDIIGSTSTAEWFVTETEYEATNTYPLGWGAWGRNLRIGAYESDVMNNTKLAMEVSIEGDGVVNNAGAHPDVLQQNADVSGWVVYNVLAKTHITQLFQLTGVASGAVVNYACLTSDAALAGASNLGNEGQPHTATHLYVINCSLPQSDILMRDGDGDEIQENLYVLGAVAKSIPFNVSCVTLRNHCANPSATAYNDDIATVQESGSPFVGGLAYDDDAGALNRDLTPDVGSQLLNRLPIEQVLVAGDALFRRAIAPGAVGSLLAQSETAIVSVSLALSGEVTITATDNLSYLAITVSKDGEVYDSLVLNDFGTPLGPVGGNLAYSSLVAQDVHSPGLYEVTVDSASDAVGTPLDVSGVVTATLRIRRLASAHLGARRAVIARA